MVDWVALYPGCKGGGKKRERGETWICVLRERNVGSFHGCLEFDQWIWNGYMVWPCNGFGGLQQAKKGNYFLWLHVARSIQKLGMRRDDVETVGGVARTSKFCPCFVRDANGFLGLRRGFFHSSIENKCIHFFMISPVEEECDRHAEHCADDKCVVDRLG